MVYTGKEIITFQFGHYSNFVGTHWWNCQEASFEYIPGTLSEINHDVLFREGVTSRGEVTYTPRLLLVDLKASLGVLPESGRLYDAPLPPDLGLPLWPSDKVSVQSISSESKNDFLQDLEIGETSAPTLPDGLVEKGHAVPKLYHMEDSVNTWSDFLRPHLHPRSINLVSEYRHNDTSLPFDTFPQGHSLWSKPRFNEEFTDRIRLYLEETDNLQGFQLLVDSFDGFSGLGCGGLQYLRDEYPSKAALCYVCQPPQFPETTPKQDSVRIVNQALALSSLAEHSSLFVPVSGSTQAWRNLGPSLELPHINYRPDLYYHTAAIIASALDTVSLIYRLHSSSERLSDLTSRFGLYNRRATALSAGLPFPMRSGATLLDTLEAWEGPLTHSLTPCIEIHKDLWLQTLVLRGVPDSKLMRADQYELNSANPAYSSRTLNELLKSYLLFENQAMVATQVTTASSSFNTTTPFPHIFSDYISCDGQIDKTPRLRHLGVNKVPMIAGLHTGPSMGHLLESLHSEAKKVNIRSVHQFADSGLETTELFESLEQLLCLSENYSDNVMDL